MTETAPTAPAPPSFRDALRFWLKLGFISFGGPTGQIAIMHTELVEKRRWISNDRFLHALNYCMLLPGPEATQLATYIGWLLHRTWGGVVAGTLFFLPAAVLLWILSFVHVRFGDLPFVSAIFYGLKASVLAIVLAAMLRIGKKALRTPVMWLVAAASFGCLFFLKVPFPAVILGAVAVGLLGMRLRAKWFIPAPIPVATNSAEPEAVLNDDWHATRREEPRLSRAVRVAGICLLLWFLPVLAAGVFLGTEHTIFEQGIFFSKAAMVTFGGAYAVLPYVSQQAVEAHGWITASQMMDGLALAETTPGPLIMVLQYVGFVGAWNHPGGLHPLTAATLGAAMTTWTTFVPCFLWILVGAPYIEHWRGSQRLNAALGAVTAAVVGVILNLAVWFAWHILLPAPFTLDWFSFLLAAVTFVGLWRWKWGILPVVLGGGAAGLVYQTWLR